MWTYDKQQVGTRIRKQRKALDYTQDELAAKIGKSTKFCADVERGTCGMSIETMLNICFVLHLSPNTLLLGDGQKSSVSPLCIEDALAQCTPCQREKISKLVSLVLNDEL